MTEVLHLCTLSTLHAAAVFSSRNSQHEHAGTGRVKMCCTSSLARVFYALERLQKHRIEAW